MKKDTKKILNCDLNWVYVEEKNYNNPRLSKQFPSAPSDWAFLDPKEYFDWHMEIGINTFFCWAYVFSRYAFYPTRLGPVVPCAGRELLPILYEVSKNRGIPFLSYFCIGTDLIMVNLRDDWVIPGSVNMPYFYPDDPLRNDHPFMNESDMLFS